MSSLEGVCGPSDELALAVLQYLALRESERSFEAARLRKRFRQLADDALAASAAARAKRDEALKSAKPLSQWTPSGPIPLPPRPANENSLSMGPNLA